MTSIYLDGTNVRDAIDSHQRVAIKRLASLGIATTSMRFCDFSLFSVNYRLLGPR